MPSVLSECIIKFLGYGNNTGVSSLEGFSLREWRRTLPWLDASGLALYFLDRVELLHGASVVPPSILARLRRNQEDNHERTAALTEEMGAIHQSLYARGVEFAVLKGYSLVPEYCQAPALRHQCDLDYLVSENDLERANSILGRMGYSRVQSAPGSFTFARSTGQVPSRHHMYKAGLNFSVEMHTALWDNCDVAELEQLPEVLPRRRPHQVSWLTFPALSRDDQFVHQCVHVLSHILQFWIRLAWLYEIATFLKRARTDSAFWQAVQKRIDGRNYVGKATRLVSLLAAAIFEVECPTLGSDGQALRLWVNEYGRRWAIHKQPGSKLSLFLFPEFMDESSWRRLRRQRLFPIHLPHPATQVSASHPKRTLPARLAEYAYAGRRLAFHVREAWRYFGEKSNWRRCLEELKESPHCQPNMVMQ